MSGRDPVRAEIDAVRELLSDPRGGRVLQRAQVQRGGPPAPGEDEGSGERREVVVVLVPAVVLPLLASPRAHQGDQRRADPDIVPCRRRNAAVETFSSRV